MPIRVRPILAGLRVRNSANHVRRDRSHMCRDNAKTMQRQWKYNAKTAFLHLIVLLHKRLSSIDGRIGHTGIVFSHLDNVIPHGRAKNIL